MADARVLVVGPTSENLLVTLDRLPDPVPHTLQATSSRTALGGTSAGKALHLVDLGIPTTLLTTRGEDATGEALMARLERCGVDVRPVTASGVTERHLNLMSARGERVSIYLDPCGEIPDQHMRAARAWAMEAMREAEAMFLDLSALLVGVGTLPRRGQARAEGPRLPFNPECSDGGEDDGADQV